MIAALFVRPDGPYAGRDDVDAWPEERDARAYAGPWPVIAHPPCQAWGRLAHVREVTCGRRRGEDAGCFASAVASVRAYGGVLEHPEGSRAFYRYHLPIPRFGEGWTAGLFGWSVAVDQAVYGHPARKRTWLFWFGEGAPPNVSIDDGSALATHVVVKSRRLSGVRLPELGKRRRELSPPAFADLMINLARASRPS